MKSILFLIGFITIISCDNQSPLEPVAEKPPEILSLISNTTSIKVGYEIEITAVLNDTLNTDDTLIWSCNAGVIVDSGITAYWYPPVDEGSYTISCQVKLPEGGGDISTLEFSVHGVYNNAALKLPSDDDAEDLLFYSSTPIDKNHPGGRNYIYYHGQDGLNSSLDQFSYISFRSSDNKTGAIIFDDDFRPRQFILPGLSIINYRNSNRENDTVASVAISAGDSVPFEELVTVRLTPDSIAPLLNIISKYAGVSRDTLNTIWAYYGNKATFTELVDTCKKMHGYYEEDSFIDIVFITMLSYAHFLNEVKILGDSRAVAEKSRFWSLAFGSISGEMMKGLLLNMGGTEIAFFLAGSPYPEPNDPNAPTLYVLKCCGQSKLVQTCHYTWFDADIGKCLQVCLSSLGCFTDICMPDLIDANKADKFIHSLD